MLASFFMWKVVNKLANYIGSAYYVCTTRRFHANFVPKSKKTKKPPLLWGEQIENEQKKDASPKRGEKREIVAKCGAK